MKFILRWAINTVALYVAIVLFSLITYICKATGLASSGWP